MFCACYRCLWNYIIFDKQIIFRMSWLFYGNPIDFIHGKNWAFTSENSKEPKEQSQIGCDKKRMEKVKPIESSLKVKVTSWMIHSTKTTNEIPFNNYRISHTTHYTVNSVNKSLEIPKRILCYLFMPILRNNNINQLKPSQKNWGNFNQSFFHLFTIDYKKTKSN